MIGIVIVAHGGLAREYRSAVEHVVGPQTNITTIAVGAEDNRTDKSREIVDAAVAVDQGQGVVVVSDIFGGSPSNLCASACAFENRRFVYGANLPLLIKLAKSRDLDIDDAVAAALRAGHQYMDSYDPRAGARAAGRAAQ